MSSTHFKRNIFIFAAVAIWMGTSALTHAAAWKSFSSSDGGFQVMFPGSPKLSQNTHKSFVGAIQENTYAVQTNTGTYSVEYSNLPGIAVDLGGQNTIFNKAKKGLLESVGGTEQSTVEIFLAGTYNGREVLFQTGSGNQGKAQFFLVNKRLYVLVATSTQPNSPGFPKFFNSFQLL